MGYVFRVEAYNKLEQIMNDQELKKMIWEKFRSQLEAHGATDIEVIFKDVPPKASELAKKGAILIKIGNVKKHIVWLIKRNVSMKMRHLHQ